MIIQEVKPLEDGVYFARGQMVQAFEDVAFSTPVGEFSNVFQSEFGYHILKVHDHRDAVIREFKDVRHDIEAMLFDERKNDAIGTVADELRAAARIENLEVVEDCAPSFKSKDVEDLRSKLEMLLAAPVLLAEYEEKAKQHILKRFTWDGVTNSLEELYLGLLSK